MKNQDTAPLRWALAFAMALASVGVHAQQDAQPSCQIRNPPDDAKVRHRGNGEDVVFYPAVIPRGFTGCLKMWTVIPEVQSQTLRRITYFENGVLRSIDAVKPIVGRPHRCVYSSLGKLDDRQSTDQQCDRISPQWFYEPPAEDAPANCRHDTPPVGARFNAADKTFTFPPSPLPGDFTGCHTVWEGEQRDPASANRRSRTHFKNGVARSHEMGEPGDVIYFFRCVFDDKGGLEPRQSGDLCPLKFPRASRM